MYDDHSAESFGVEGKDIPGPGTYAPKIKFGKGQEANFGATKKGGKNLVKGGRFGTSRREQLGSSTPLNLAVREARDNQIQIGGHDLFSAG